MIQDDLAAAIAELCVLNYQTETGARIKGQSISYLSQLLRDRGWRGVSNLNDLETLVEERGFRVIKAQTIKCTGRLAPPARCVTAR